VDYIVWDDSRHGDGDGILESGEEARFYPYIQNVGNARARDVNVMVSGNPLFNIHEAWKPYRDMQQNMREHGDSYAPNSGGSYSITEIPMNLAGTLYTDVVVEYGEGVPVSYTIHDVPIQITSTPYLRAKWVDNLESQLDFGQLAPGDPLVRQVQISNPGSAPLQIRRLMVFRSH
jgi:hypothetical protein